MQKLLLCFLTIVFTSINLQAQSKINLKLKKELDSMMVLDQKFRGFLYSEKGKIKKDSLLKAFQVTNEDLEKILMQKQSVIDISNLKRIEDIIQKHGYPGKSLVGTPTNEVAFYIIQHSGKIKELIPYVEKAAQTNQLPFNNYAMMLDRWLMEKEESQIYGTQIYTFTAQNSSTLKIEQHKIVWPIKDLVNINKLRKEVGFSDTIEEYAKKFTFEYKVITMAQYKEMAGL